jgi:hypothetical protein
MEVSFRHDDRFTDVPVRSSSSRAATTVARFVPLPDKVDLYSHVFGGNAVIAVFEDRWGGRVQASTAESVVLLDDAIESLVALAGDPSARANEAVAADDGLILGHITRAYLALYRTTQKGVAQAKEILSGLDAARASHQSLARTLVAERVARKPLAREAAYRLLATNTA